MDLDTVIGNARKAVAKGKGKLKGKKAKSSDFDVDLKDSKDSSAESKKAQRSKRRAAKSGDDKATKKSKRSAKADKSSKTEKVAKGKKSRRTARADKAAGKRAKKTNGTGAVAYKGDLAKNLMTDLDRPGKLSTEDQASVNNHFIYALNKVATKQFSVTNISKTLSHATAETFGAKIAPKDFEAVAGKIASAATAKLARSAKKYMNSLKVKSGKVTSDSIADAVAAALDA